MNRASTGAVPPAGAPPPLLTVEQVTLQYKTPERFVTAAWEVDFTVYPADRFILLGPSGCGKSSLLKAVAGFLKPVAGRIRLKGRAVTGPGPDRMMVFQEFDQLLPWLTVRDNILFPLLASRKLPRPEAADRAMSYLEKVNLAPFAGSYPHTLSGGMKQRVAIARAMAMESDILLMDEPFAALDALTRRKMQDELLHLWEDTGFSFLFVTHSIEEAVIVGSRILLLTPHPGQVKAELDAGRHAPFAGGQRDSVELQERIHALLFTEPVAPELVHHE